MWNSNSTMTLPKLRLRLRIMAAALGRPVIYGPELEFHTLSEGHRWRHMRYEPPDVDFGWEREWRIKCASLAFDRTTASIVVQDDAWAQQLVRLHEHEQECRAMQYSMILDDTLIRLYYEPFRWNIIRLH